MQKAYADTNFFIRLALDDIPEVSEVVQDYLGKAKKGKLEIILTPLVVLETISVLQEVYGLAKHQIADFILAINEQNFIVLEGMESDGLSKFIGLYLKHDIDAIDLFLVSQAKQKKYDVLSFDSDVVTLLNRKPSA